MRRRWIRFPLRQKSYLRHSGTDFGPVDVVKYADAFSATGIQIADPDDIAPALNKAFDTAGPMLVGVNVDYSKNPGLFETVHEGSIL